MLAYAIVCGVMPLIGARAANAVETAVDLALVLAVDTSSSVNAERYRLQMDGIARAFEDPAVHQTILAGKHGAIAVALVQWANTPLVSLPWVVLDSPETARAYAVKIRTVSRFPGDFTCMALAMKVIDDRVLTLMPYRADRVVVDVSGDGRDNCNAVPSVAGVRDDLVASGVTVNGLPILEGDEANSLERWYLDNVIGGPGAFLIPAFGFADFQRAIREKFLEELISELRLPHAGPRVALNAEAVSPGRKAK